MLLPLDVGLPGDVPWIVTLRVVDCPLPHANSTMQRCEAGCGANVWVSREVVAEVAHHFPTKRPRVSCTKCSPTTLGINSADFGFPG